MFWKLVSLSFWRRTNARNAHWSEFILIIQSYITYTSLTHLKHRPATHRYEKLTINFNIIVIKYAASRFMDLWKIIPYVWLKNCSFHLFRSSASSFSSQCLLLYLKSFKSCVLLLPTSFTFIICLSIAYKGGNFFSEYEQSKWLFYLGYYLEVSSSLLYVQEFPH